MVRYEKKEGDLTSHLNFLDHLFSKGADLCRDTDGDVFCSAVLAAHAVEHTRTFLDVAAQVGLKNKKKRTVRSQYQRKIHPSLTCSCTYLGQEGNLGYNNAVW